MQREKISLWLFVFIWTLLFCSVGELQSRPLTSSQPAIPLKQMDAESLLLTVSQAESFTIDPTLEVPTEDQGERASLFAMALHRDWVLLMGPSGWQPYSGEITMFDQVSLGETLNPFSIDGNRLISSAGDSIDLFYGYAVEQPFFFGNAIRFQRVSPDRIQGERFEISQTATPLETLNPLDLPLTAISDTCRTIAPSLQVADSDLGYQANLFAVIVAGDSLLVKTSQGWSLYSGGDLNPFATVTLTKELKGFDLPSTMDTDDKESPLSSSYGGEALFYYAYTLDGRTTTFLGNGLRFHRVPPDQIQGAVFGLSQTATDFDQLTGELPLTLISETCHTISPALHVADLDVGKSAQLYAAIITGGEVMVKTSEGWMPYDGGTLLPFSQCTLGNELAGFELPATYEGEVLFYYAYLANRETLFGNAMRVTVAQ